MLLKTVFYLTFILFSFGQLARVSFFGQQINGYIYEIFLLLVTLVLFFKYRFRPIQDSYRRYKIIYFFLAYLFISYLAGLARFKPEENFIAALYQLRLILYFLYFFYLTYHVQKLPQFKKTLEQGLVVFLFVTLVSSVLQYFFYPDLRNLLYAGWDPHLYRLFGVFFDTSVAGSIYGLLFLTLFLQGKKLIKNKWLLTIFLAFYFIFCLLTFSRSLYIVLTTVVIWISIKKSWYKSLVIFLALFFLLIVAAPKPFGEGVNLGRMFSVQSRLTDYQDGLKIWSRQPVLGIGYNRIRYAKRQMNIISEVGADLTHAGASFSSSFVVILVSGGIIGLVLFTGVLVRIAWLSEFAKYAIAFLSLLSLSDNIILHPFILFLFFSLLPLTLATPSRRLR